MEYWIVLMEVFEELLFFVLNNTIFKYFNFVSMLMYEHIIDQFV